MAAIAPVVLQDGKDTPADVTFDPVTIDAAGVAKWTNRSGGIALGFPAITQSLRAPSKTSRNYRLTVKVVTPVLEATSPSTATGIQPAPTKAYDLLATVEFVIPERSSLSERKNIAAFVENYFSKTSFVKAVQEFESVY